jgi:hypothetical protein
MRGYRTLAHEKRHERLQQITQQKGRTSVRPFSSTTDRYLLITQTIMQQRTSKRAEIVRVRLGILEWTGR